MIIYSILKIYTIECTKYQYAIIISSTETVDTTENNDPRTSRVCERVTETLFLRNK